MNEDSACSWEVNEGDWLGDRKLKINRSNLWRIVGRLRIDTTQTIKIFESRMKESSEVRDSTRQTSIDATYDLSNAIDETKYRSKSKRLPNSIKSTNHLQKLKLRYYLLKVLMKVNRYQVYLLTVMISISPIFSDYFDPPNNSSRRPPTVS